MNRLPVFLRARCQEKPAVACTKSRPEPPIPCEQCPECWAYGDPLLGGKLHAHNHLDFCSKSPNSRKLLVSGA